MIKNLEGHRMSRRKFIKTHSISGATSEDAIHYVKPILTRNSDEIILHFGTNDIASKYKTIENYRKIINKIKHSSQRTRISISSIIMRGDNIQMNKDIQIMNDELYKLCREHKLDFINNNNITMDSLNGSRRHLNRQGNILLARNIINHLQQT